MDKYKEEKIREYNNEPVFFCKSCFSLSIKGKSHLYCSKCGCDEIKTININDWEKMFEMKYGFNFLKGDTDGKRS